MAKAKVEEKKLTFKERAALLEKEFSIEEQDRILIPTGSMGLDWAIGGGWCTGKLYEIMAWEGAGKTTFCKHAIAEVQKLSIGEVVCIDAEHAFDRQYAENIGVDWERLSPGFFQPNCGEDGYTFAKALIETGEVRLLIIDSMNGMKPRKELEDPAGSVNMGLHARLQGTEVLKLKNLAAKYNTAIICISQFREKIGVMYGSPETTQGGNALRYWADCRIDLRRENVTEGAAKDVVAINTKVKVIKNKICPPYRKVKVPLSFGVGIDVLAEVIMLGKETDVLKTRMNQGVNYITIGEDKYTEADFITLLKDNPDFYNDLKGKIAAQLNNVTVVGTPDTE